MNRFGWFVLNVTLVAALCGVGMLLGESDPAAHWRTVKEGILESATPGEKDPIPEPPTEPVAEVVKINRFPMDSKTADVLWQHTLFNPDRTEDIEVKREVDAAKKEAVPEFQFEVRGIMMVREEWIVSLSVRQQSAARPAARTIAPRRPNVVTRGAEVAPEKPQKTTGVYHKGDSIQDTGYIVADITMQAVTLKRGEEELVLSVDLNDEMSQQRRSEAARIDAAKTPPPAKDAGATEGSVVSTLPAAGKNTPPPPPPAPGAVAVAPAIGVPATSTSGGSVEERLKRIRERQEILRKDYEKKRSTK